MPALQGKVAIITGGSSGIGLAIAKRFVLEGAYVFITGRRQPEPEKAASEIGKDVTVVQGDVSNLEDLDRLYSAVSSQDRRIDIVVAGAGLVLMAPVTTATDGTTIIHKRERFLDGEECPTRIRIESPIELIDCVRKTESFVMIDVDSSIPPRLAMDRLQSWLHCIQP